jgi:hypothetical protein
MMLPWKMVRSINMVQFRKLVYPAAMRTSVSLDDDVHEFASSYAHGRGITLSAALNELVRQAESAPKAEPEIRRSPNGFPLLPRTGQVITSEMVKKYSEDHFE